MDNEKEISFGAFDSELMHQEIYIPEGFEATIDGNKIILKKIESEDERIRKELIEHVKDQQSSFISAPDCRDKYEEEENNKYNSWLSWLEKQGTSYTKRDVDDAYLKGISDAKNELEKQGEQKPADKEEPKFHKGEWITNGDYTWKIVEINPLDYILQSQDGNIVDDTISHVDEQFHSFTIQDAKDGDVLAEDTCTFIIKKLNRDLTAEIYCCLFSDGDFEINSNLGFDDTCTYPATKEQRDLLFQKMHKAGYEWNADKKELKKIENVTPTAWSEEDEKCIRLSTDIIDSALRAGFCVQLDRDRCVDWFNSRRLQKQWKPSDEQITVLELASKYERVFTSKQIDILIGLKEQLKEL